MIYPVRPNAGTTYFKWSISERDRLLVQWLIDNVGAVDSDLYKLPLFGKGWAISEGYDEDPHLMDYYYRKWPSGVNYVPRGKYGFWLELDETNAAILKLNGLLGK